MNDDRHANLTQLGKLTRIPESPEEAVLESVADPHPDTPYLVRFECPEFTCLCPVTGQPDFARFVLDYVPKAHILESKSLKLYLASFRNQAAFHEDATLSIAKRIEAAIAPAWLRICGFWNARGGIPITVFYQTAEPPSGVWIPTPETASCCSA